MKPLKTIAISFVVVIIMLSCVAFSACGKNAYEVRLSIASGCNISTDNLQVELFDFDGKSVKKAALNNGKVNFNVDSGNYVAALSPIGEQYDYAVAILTKSKKTATITLKNASKESNSDEFLHTLTVYIKNFNIQNDYRLEVCETSPLGVCRNVDNVETEKVNLNLKFNSYNAKLLVAGNQLNAVDFSFNDAKRFVIL